MERVNYQYQRHEEHISFIIKRVLEGWYEKAVSYKESEQQKRNAKSKDEAFTIIANEKG